jgi:hypothetical protein
VNTSIFQSCFKRINVQLQSLAVELVKIGPISSNLQRYGTLFGCTPTLVVFLDENPAGCVGFTRSFLQRTPHAQLQLEF